MSTLVLWDVDHTLITIRGLTREIYAQTFLDVTGQPLTEFAVMAGRTERAIITDTLRAHGMEPHESVVLELADAVSRAYVARRMEIPTRGAALPGAREALEALAAHPNVVQSVLTGNTETIARAKLSAFALDGFLDLTVGAYGLDHIERPPLVALAQERASQKYGKTFGPTTTVLIGDTPHDIQAAHKDGGRIVAVATGSTPATALQAAGANHVLNNLTNTTTLLRAVLGTNLHP